MSLRTKEKRGIRLKDNKPGEKFVASIPMIGFLLLGIFPIVLSFFMSFTELHSTYVAEMEWVGLENYKEVFGNGKMRGPIITTLVYCLQIPFRVFGALFVAQQLNKLKRGKTFFSIVLFIPCVCSMVAVALTFKLLYRTEGGVLNNMLNALGFESFAWLAESPMTYMCSVMVMSLWMSLGSTVIMYRAALSSVDKSYYEAATIDGATPMQIFWKITWPAVSPITGHTITMTIISCIGAMGEMMMLEPGVTLKWFPESYTAVGDTVARHIYNMIFVNPRSAGYGMAAAAGWVLAVVILIISRVNTKVQRKWVNYDF